MLRNDMLRMAKPCAFLGGFGGMPPREIFSKWCNLVRFSVYLDHILNSNYCILALQLNVGERAVQRAVLTPPPFTPRSDRYNFSFFFITTYINDEQ